MALRRGRGLAGLLVGLMLLCTACTGPWESMPQPTESQRYRAQAEAAADVQLGVLRDYLTPQERERVVAQLEQLIPLRESRMAEDRYERDSRETRLVEVLNRLYERYTVKYLGDSGTWGYTYPTERLLGEYKIQDGTTLVPDPGFKPRPGGPYTREEQETLWEDMRALLPEGAFADFDRFTVFTDGVDETLAYVVPTDDRGARWEIAVDPADAADWDWFTETVLHEYTHYLTLNDEQAEYPGRRTASTYSEAGLAAMEGSYLNDFYLAFWTELLDDRLADRESFHFFVRHEDAFVSPYAATDPAEDIAESFTYYILWQEATGDAVWEQKLRFFSAYPELVSFRAQVRDHLGFLP